MKKTLFMMALAAIVSINASAQRQQMTQEQIEAFQAQMTQRQAERLAQDFELKDEAQAKFIATYTEYQRVLMAVQSTPQQMGNRQQAQDPKKMTDEEATAQIDQAFARQEEQIKVMQQRLIVDRAYYEEFKKTLTPQQLVQIFGRQQRYGMFGQQGGNRQSGTRQRGNRNSNQSGNFGGGNFGGGDSGGGDFGGGDSGGGDFGGGDFGGGGF